MIMKSDHPWQNFLHARKLAIEWFIKAGYTNKQIAMQLSMIIYSSPEGFIPDEVQVQLIHMTEVEE